MKALLSILVSFVISTSAIAETEQQNNAANFRFSAVGLLLGAVVADVDFQINENWTLGPTMAIWNFTVGATGSNVLNTDVSFFSVGGRGNWYRNGVHTDGLYVAPALSYNTVKLKSGSDSGSASGLVASGLVGYGWFWKSFNMLLGGGMTLPLGITSVEVNGEKYSTSGTSAGLALEYTLGWTF
jgi:hypothetical protein